jgi:hypothetical protein
MPHCQTEQYRRHQKVLIAYWHRPAPRCGSLHQPANCQVGKVRKIQALAAGPVLALALSGCTRNTVVFLVPQVNPAPISCWTPADAQKHYLVPREMTPVQPVASAIAQAQHVSGCAAAVFQLTRDGKATNISILREFPPSYGYGEAVSDAIRKSTFASPASGQDWYYRAVTIILGPARPGIPGQVVPSQRT